MLHSTHSNRLEILVEHLTSVVCVKLEDPVWPETVVVPNQGMARWLSQAIAERAGILANFEFPLPAAFFWRNVTAWLPDAPDQAAYEKETLAWRIFGLLPDLLSSPAFAPLARYLEKDPSDLRRFQLCQRIADLFDQYLIYRQDLCLAWEEGGDDDGDWQPILWRTLSAEIGAAHRARLVADFQRALAAGEPPRAWLPKRVSLFGISALAPVQIQMLGALASFTEVRLFCLNPCREYWADLEDDKRQAKRRAAARRASLPDPTGLLDIGNPLLASFGHGGQIFLDQLLELGGEDSDAFDDPGTDSLLHRLQSDILDLADRRRDDEGARCAISPDDISLQILGAHSPQREIQILHDRLLTLFARLPGLEPRDIIVMAPDIDAYAPYVDAVFGSVPGDQHIPWSIADRSAGADQPLLAAVGWLLGLLHSRLEATAVLSLLQVPAVQRRFGVDDDGLEKIATWIAESGVRWGLDEQTREELGLPSVRENSWAFGLERLFLGYAMPPDAEQDPYRNILPYIDIEGAEVEYLGALQALIEKLATWRGRLCDARQPAAWLSEINALVADFFDPGEEDSDAMAALRSGMDALVGHWESAAVGEPLTSDLIAFRLREALDEPSGSRNFLSGRATFCNMVPMRSIPFRVLCLLGMNGSDFPRSQRPLSFDLVGQSPRRGDRSRRRDDRYLFLEALLSARDSLYISWVSNDTRDNSQRVPSVVVDELLDYVGKSFRLDGGGKLLEHLVVRHPLQPFSRRYFDGEDPRLATHSKRWLAAAQVEPVAEVPPFALAPLDHPDAALRTLDVTDLISFLRDPAEHFLRHRLGMRLPQAQDLTNDDEPFAIDFLERYWLRDALIAERAAGRTPEDSLKRLRAAGSLPHGPVGEIVVDAQREVVESILGRRARFEGSLIGPVEVDLNIDEFELQGQLRDLAETGLVLSRPGKIRCKDRLSAWVRHLLLCALAPDTVQRCTVFVGEDITLVLGPVKDPLAIVGDLLALRWKGLSEPIPFFPESALACMDSGRESGDFNRAWRGDGLRPGEGDAIAVRMAWRGRDPIETDFEGFKQYAIRVLAPLMEYSEDIAKGDETP